MLLCIMYKPVLCLVLYGKLRHKKKTSLRTCRRCGRHIFVQRHNVTTTFRIYIWKLLRFILFIRIYWGRSTRNELFRVFERMYCIFL